MLYTVLVQAGMFIGAVLIWRNRIDYIKRENPSFGQIMVEATFIGAFMWLYMSPFSQLLEHGKKAQYVSSWTDYEVREIWKEDLQGCIQKFQD
jgi:hypothetical protein